MNHSDCEGGENEKHKLASQGPPHKTGYVHLGIPLAAVIARLRGRTLVKVLRVDDLEETKTTHPR